MQRWVIILSPANFLHIKEKYTLWSAISQKTLWNNPLLTDRIPLGTFGELKNGYAFKSSTYIPNSKYRIITIANVSGEREIDTGGCNTIPILPKDLQPHQLLNINDILISLTGNVGRVSLCGSKDSCLNQRVGLFVLNNYSHHEYIFQVLSDRHFLHSMIESGQGAAQMNIGKGDVESFLIPFADNPTLINRISQLLLSLDSYIELEKKRYLLSFYMCVH